MLQCWVPEKKESLPLFTTQNIMVGQSCNFEEEKTNLSDWAISSRASPIQFKDHDWIFYSALQD